MEIKGVLNKLSYWWAMATHKEFDYVQTPKGTLFVS